MSDSESVRRDIEATRRRLAQTAAALAYRADMPARVRENVLDAVVRACASAQPYVARVRSIAGGTAAVGRLALARASAGVVRGALAPNAAEKFFSLDDGARGQLIFTAGALGAGVVIGLLLPQKTRARR